MTDKNHFLYFGVLPALFFQLGGALVYFLFLKNSALAPVAYAITKLVILIWPLIWWNHNRSLYKESSQKSPFPSLAWGLGTGVGIGGLILLVYVGFQGYFDQFGHLMLDKVRDFNLEAHFLWYALFLSLIHSFWEEYYWRWFIFKGLFTRFSWGMAAFISSLAFAAHHYVVLIQFFPPLTTVLLGTAVGIGGFIWCYLYFRTGHLWAAWISHALVDLGVMAAGYWILF